MDMAAQLTPGCILDMRNATPQRGQIVQLIDVRKLTSSVAGGAASGDRYRLVISDGTHFIQGMVATTLHDMMKDVSPNAIIRLDAWSNNSVSGRVIVVIMALSVVHPDVGFRIGQPTAIDGDASAQARAQAAPQAQAQCGGAPPAAQPGYGQPPMQPQADAYGAQPQPQGGYGGYQQQPPQMQSYGQPPPQAQWQQPPPAQQGYGQPPAGGGYDAGGGYGGMQQPQAQPQPQWQQQQPQQQQQQWQQPPPPQQQQQWQQPPQQQYQQQQPQYQQQQQQQQLGGGAQYGDGGGGGGGNGPVHRAGEDAVTMPIGAINPYQNRWAIKGRVSQKGPKKTYTNARGEGTLFSFTLCDADADIRLTCFNDVALRLHPIVNVGDILFVRNGQVKAANERYNNTSSRFEITLSNSSEVVPITDDAAAAAEIPSAHYVLVPIAQLGQMDPEAPPGGGGAGGANAPPSKGVDILGALLSVGEMSTFTSKAGKEFKKRVVEIADDSGASIEMTIWGELAETFAGAPGDIAVAKGARLSSWNGRSLSSSFDGDVFLHPQHERAPQVKAWYNAGGASTVNQLSTGGSGGGGGGSAGPRKTLGAVGAEGIGLSKEPQSWSAMGTVMLIKSNKEIWYCSCAKCKKKVTGDDAQMWSCEACGWSGPECVRRYIGRFQISDPDGSVWVNAYDEVLSEIMGMSADELSRLRDVDERAYEAHLREKSFGSYVFGLRSVLDEWNNEARTKHSAVALKPLSYEAEARSMLEGLKLA